MTDKNTDKLMNELKTDKDISRYLEENAAYLKDLNFGQYLSDMIAQKGLSVSDVAERSGISYSYVYHIANGDRNPSRSKILAIAFGLGATLDETQQMLRQARYGILYPRDKWDAVIITALRQRLTVIETNELLEKLGETVFLI